MPGITSIGIDGRKALAVFHGYHLDGSGSCVYVRSVVEQLARLGRDIVLFCQEPHTERYSFVSEARRFNPDGTTTRLFSRRPVHAGKVTCFIPFLKNDLLPVFVPGDFPGFDRIKPFAALTDEELGSYIESNVHAVETVMKDHGIRCVFGQHIVMSSFIARLACGRIPGARYFVCPHGSEMEYLIRRNARYKSMALETLEHAEGIITSSEEMNRRLDDLFEGSGRFRKRYIHVPVAVDAGAFSEPLAWSVPDRVSALTEQIGKEIAEHAGSPDRPAPDVVERLGRIDFDHDPVLCCFGRLIPAKGVHELLFVAPKLFQSLPGLKMIIAGSGPYAGAFKELVRALQAGDGDAYLNLLNDGVSADRGDAADPCRSIHGYLQKGRKKEYFEEARSFDWAGNIVFAGFLRHPALRLLLSLCRVCVFPSIVREAYCLALYEAAAAGSFPVATDQGGLKEGTDRLGEALEPGMRRLMKIPAEGPARIREMIEKIPEAFKHRDSSDGRLSGLVRSQYGWEEAARRLSCVLRDP